MKQIYKLFLCCCFMSIAVNAQDTLDCDYNFGAAKFYLEGNENIDPNLSKAIEYLTPCVESGDARAQLLMARIHLNDNDIVQNKKGFQLTKKAAKQNYPLAAYDMGVLFKYGNGGKEQNLKKAVKWFKKGHELGNSKASYALGYMYLKGFGGEYQNYKKAVKWFKKSEDPMAKQWLAVCHYFGYGVDENKSKALKMLRSDSIENGEVLLTSLEQAVLQNELNEEEAFILNELSKDETTTEESQIVPQNLSGKWTGSLIQLDWANTKVMQKFPTTIEFEKGSGTDNFTYKSVIDQNENLGEGYQLESTINLDNLLVKLKRPYSINNNSDINYQVDAKEIVSFAIENEHYIAISTENFITEWKEPGAPLVFILKKEKVRTENNVQISQEALDALAAQENFIKLYPNPFESDLIISYDLDTKINVDVTITSIDGASIHNVVKNQEQNIGTYNYYFDGSSMPKGVYVISIVYGNEKKTKMIVKN